MKWEKEGQYHRGNLFGFEIGPSVKFVSAIIDAFSNKWGQQIINSEVIAISGGG